MSTKHTVTDATPTGRMTKSEASRQNGHKSRGPKTSRGKSHSRKSALKHGLYSKELLISPADQAEFRDLRAGLRAQLKPSTVLQENAFDHVVACHWRCKLAMRLEQRQFAHRLQYEQPGNSHDEAVVVDGVIARWYGCSRSDTNAAIRGLQWAREEFDNNGSFREETRDWLRRGFGEDYLRLLEEWTMPMSLDAMLMAEQLTEKKRIFGPMYHPTNQGAETSSESGETTKVEVDPKQGRHMVCKLLEQRRDFLRELLTITDQNTLEGRPYTGQSWDFNPRFLADASRELRRALDWYLSLKEKGL